MGKCRFNTQWLLDARYRDWVRVVPGSNDEARCCVCRKTFNLTTLGHLALESHMKSIKHNATALHRQPPIAQFCTAQPPNEPRVSTSNRNESQQHQPSQTSSIRTATAQAGPSSGVMHVGGAPTLRAEVLWILHTIYDQHSYNSNEGISEIFKVMFDDSEIAAAFTCGKNKTSYITKFGLAPYITKLLVKDVNEASGGFVAMFDESQQNYKNQANGHLRYWSGDHVASRYLGSQFMGHGKAEDLLKHFKVSVFFLLSLIN